MIRLDPHILASTNGQTGRHSSATFRATPAKSGETPLEKVSESRRLTPETTVSSTSRAPILVVDDDRGIREIIAETLEFEGYQVAQAKNGAEALEMIAENPPSLVLLDMRMPVLDGWGVARALRARGIRLPIVVVTAAKDARAWANEIGAIGYLAKPFEDSDLLEAVDRYQEKIPSE